MSHHTEAAGKIAKSKLSAFDSDKLKNGRLEPDDKLIPSLSILNLLDQQLDNDPKQFFPNFVYHICSKRMYRFIDWIDYNNLHNNEPLLEFVEFVEDKKQI